LILFSLALAHLCGQRLLYKKTHVGDVIIKCTILGSGSSGNCVYVEVDGHTILLDAGLTFKKLCIRISDINKRVGLISKVFVSHQHGDHVRSLPMLEKKVRPCPYIYSEYAGNLKDNDTVFLDNSDGGANSPVVTAFRLDHDDPCLGFSVEDGDGNKLVYVTDTGSIPCDSMGHMLDAGILIIEANHDTDLLNKGPYPVDLQERVFETHLENYQMRELVDLLKNDKLRYVALHHLSKQNNNKKLAEYEAVSGLGSEYNHVNVIVAEQDFATQAMVLF